MTQGLKPFCKLMITKDDKEDFMTEENISAESVRALEAILLVAMEPVDPTLLSQLLEISVASIEGLCERLAAAYEEAGHGFQLVKVAGGYRFQSHLSKDSASALQQRMKKLDMAFNL